MRTVSACACARVQSKLNAAAAAAEFLSSVLREVVILSSPPKRRSDWLFLLPAQVFRERFGKSTHALSSNRWGRFRQTAVHLAKPVAPAQYPGRISEWRGAAARAFSRSVPE